MFDKQNKCYKFIKKAYKEMSPQKSEVTIMQDINQLVNELLEQKP